jgi:hypothetical protein
MRPSSRKERCGNEPHARNAGVLEKDKRVGNNLQIPALLKNSLA